MELISRTELSNKLGVSTRTLDRINKLPKGFPPKIKITARRSAYRLKDVEDWLNGREVAA